MTRKKIVWLPYDFDTALGINNEGALVFDYELEDTDHIEGGADVYNGQESVVWCNIRDAFGKELASMYQTLRSQGKLSYTAVEKAFEDHQDKWSEAIFNEDAWFKYIDPLINEGNGAYLEMLQGSKKEQRKWWLYNRFRYIDSKYNAGDALVDVIQLRGYAKANVTVIPYADIYPTVKYGSYLVHQRGKRGVATTLVNPLDSVNDTEIYIYSSSQLASVGDLSGLLVGFADFSMATKLQELKIGSDAVGYSNSNLKTLTLGNNVLLKKIDVRNCVGLGTGDQKSVDISGCTNIEEIYFDGTNITGLQLPNGGIIKKLHLPETITNLTVMNQKAITEFVIPTYQNISTLRLENVSSAIDQIEILKQIPANSRVRLIGFYMLADDAQEIDQIFDILDTMRGLDEAGNNMDTAQVSGEIHTASLTGAEIAEFNQRYPYVRVTADHTTAVLTYKTYDGATTLFTETVLDGGNGTKVNTTARIADAQYTYEPDGWSLTQDGAKDADALVGVTADRTVFASYTKTLRKYTVTWKNADNTTLETDQNVPYGSTPQYNGATPTYHGQTSTGWSPAVSTVVGDVTYTAQYKPMYTATFVRASADGGGTLYTQRYIVEGTTPVYGGSTPTTTKGSATDYPFEGWTPALAPIYANTTYTAKFGSPIEDIEITDDWDTIIANVDNGTYKTAYKVGNYKKISLINEGNISMQIVGFDVDENVDGYPVPITFVAKETLSSRKRMNVSTQNTYAYPEIPSWERHFYADNSQTYWESTNRFIESIAKMTLTLVANENVETTLNYYVSQTNGRLRIDVNGETIISDYSSNTVESYPINVLTNSTTTIYMEFRQIGNYNTYANVTLYNPTSFTITEDIQNAPSRQQTGYVDGTGAVGGWKKSELRSYLADTIMPRIPSNIQNRINPVVKYSSSINGGINDTIFKDDPSVDRLWIPSVRELLDVNTYESKGESYNKIYKNSDASTRIKHSSTATGVNVNYWLRSVYNSEKYNTVNASGVRKTESSSNSTSNYICLGFCLGDELETISDSWDTILANQYARGSYKIGDTKWMRLSSGEKVLMQIVGFSCDELASGNGVARISWISKYLLNDSLAMNSTATTEGGWETSGLRTYLNSTIKPMLPENIRNGIQSVKKYSSTYENGGLVKDGQTTNDDLWIPNYKELYSSSNWYETQGASYSTVFTDNITRKKQVAGDFGIYWLRTSSSSKKFGVVNAEGSYSEYSAHLTRCIALGFCTGATASPEDVEYIIRQTTEFNGSSTYFDTGLQLMNGRNSFSVVFDFLNTKNTSMGTGSQYAIIHCMHEDTPYPGFAIQYKRLSSGTVEYGADFIINSNNAYVGVSRGGYTSDRRVKMVLTVDYSSNKITMYSNINGTSETSENDIPSGTPTVSETALIGCYQDTNGNRGRYSLGTMYDFKIYDRALTSEEAQAYLAVDHS